MFELLKNIWQIMIGLLIATKPFWWSDFWWGNVIKYGITIICIACGVSKRENRNLIKVGLSVYAILSTLFLFVRKG